MIIIATFALNFAQSGLVYISSNSNVDMEGIERK
jgi:hypothetical protein